MRTRYDTRTAHQLDRYDYYRSAAATELAPMTVHGRAPGRLLATMSGARFGPFELELLTWNADSEVMARRTEKLIRVNDPEYYRIVLGAGGRIRTEQAENRATVQCRDLALYDMSYPFQATHATGSGLMRVVLLTFPRTAVSVDRAAVRPLIGTLVPRKLAWRSLFARFLIGLTETGDDADPATADILRDSVSALLRQRLGRAGGASPLTRRALHLAHLRNVIRRQLGDPALDPDRIAAAANISPRYLHAMFQGTGSTPMQLVRQLRLEQCHRSLLDPARRTTPIKDLIVAHGYRRADQFARDYRHRYGVSPTDTRGSIPATFTI